MAGTYGTKWIRVIGLVLALVTVGSLVVAAAPQHRSDAQSPALRLIAKQLELTPEQKQALVKVRKDAAATLKADKKQIKQALADLKTKLKSKAAQDILQAALDQLQAAREKMAADRAEIRRQVAAILTTEQKVQIALHAGPIKQSFLWRHVK